MIQTKKIIFYDEKLNIKENSKLQAVTILKNSNDDKVFLKKSRIRETLNLLTDADSKTDTTLRGYMICLIFFLIFF